MSYNLAAQTDLSNQTARAASALRYRPPTQEDAAQSEVVKESSQTTGLTWEGDKLALPEVETDVAVLTSTVSLAQAETCPEMSVFGIPLKHKNADALLAAHKAALRGSRSGNLMQERAMQTAVASCTGFLCGLFGVSAEQMTAINKEVRDEALAEIDNRLTVDWAYAKATMDILS